jgi:hypothetical protein
MLPVKPLVGIIYVSNKIQQFLRITTPVTVTDKKNSTLKEHSHEKFVEIIPLNHR